MEEQTFAMANKLPFDEQLDQMFENNFSGDGRTIVRKCSGRITKKRDLIYYRNSKCLSGRCDKARIELNIVDAIDRLQVILPLPLIQPKKTITEEEKMII